MQVAALRKPDTPYEESYRLVKEQETEKATKVQQRAAEPSKDMKEVVVGTGEMRNSCRIFMGNVEKRDHF
jgi:hypothetical protein